MDGSKKAEIAISHDADNGNLPAFLLLKSVEKVLPAGTYRLDTDEEEILGISFLAFARTATMLHVPAGSMPGDAHEVFTIDPIELAAALEADALR